MLRYNFELHSAEESGSRAGEASKEKANPDPQYW
jgi:hypothetical protein